MGRLAEAVATIRKSPILLWLPLLIAATGELTGSLFLDGLAEQTDAISLNPATIVPMIILLLSPAIASGYNAVVRSGVTGERPGMAVFAANLPTYYVRFLGGAALYMLVIAPFSLGLDLQGTYQATWQSEAVSGILAVFGEVWLAAVVLGGAGVFEAIAAALTSLRVGFADYVAALSLALVATVLLPSITLGVGSPLQPVFALLSTLAAALLSAVARVSVYQVYFAAAKRDGQAKTAKPA